MSILTAAPSMAHSAAVKMAQVIWTFDICTLAVILYNLYCLELNIHYL